MADNVYKAGLKNVGSYQVSGKPFVTASTVHAHEEEKIEFPEVTNNITIRSDSFEGSYNSLYLSSSHYVVTGAFAFDGTYLTTTSSFSIRWWGRFSDLPADVDDAAGAGSGNDIMPFLGFGASWSVRENSLQQAAGGSTFEYRGLNQVGSDPQWTNAAFPSGYSDFDARGFTIDWFHYVFTFESNDSGNESTASFYRNGVEIAGTNLERTYSSPFDLSDNGASFHIGGYQGGVRANLRDVILWDGVLSEAQANSLYQASASYSSSAFSPAGLQKLIWLKPTGSAQNLPGAQSQEGGQFYNFGVATEYLQERFGSGYDSSNVININSNSPFNEYNSAYALNSEDADGFILGNIPLTLPSNFTIIVWVKSLSDLTDKFILYNKYVRLFYRGNNKRLKLWIDRNVSAADVFDTRDLREWTHLAITVDHDVEGKLYVNGELFATIDLSTDNAQVDGENLNFGHSAAAVRTSFSEAAVFTSTFTLDEVEEAYNSGNKFDLRKHSKKSTIRNYWLFGDYPADTFNNNGASAKLTATVNDIVGSSDLTINETHADNDDFITQERHYYEQAKRSLKIHYRSTGSYNTIDNKHYWVLDSDNESFTMNVKSKEVYLSTDIGVHNYSIHADLTTIPTSMMYQHTGSGVDE